MTPDENRDVVVHAYTLVDALTGDPIGKRWSVWLAAVIGAPPYS